MGRCAPPSVRIVLATRDGAPFLGAQLRSIACQRHGAWSLDVSDDVSVDETPHLLRRFAAQHRDRAIRVVDGPGQGACANFLALLAQGPGEAEYVALSDQDDIWMPDRLSRGIAALSGGDPDVPALYAARSVLMTGERALPPPRPKRLPALSFANALVQNVMPGNTMMLNASAARLVAGAMPAIRPPFHDWWLYALLAGAGARLVLDRAPVLFYRQHGANVLGANRGAAARLLRARFVADGTYHAWRIALARALDSVAPVLTKENRETLADLLEAENRGPVARVSAARRARLRRSTPLGTVGVLSATLFGRG